MKGVLPVSNATEHRLHQHADRNSGEKSGRCGKNVVWRADADEVLEKKWPML
jgi:hypothetical protein